MKSNCTVVTQSLHEKRRQLINEPIVKKYDNTIEIVYNKNDTLEDFEAYINGLCGNSSDLFHLKKRLSTIIFSVISVVIILFALISSSLYEDIFKKVIFESPFAWSTDDTISMFFVLLFFFGLLMMPSILDGESSQLKDGLQSWFNKDTRRKKRLQVSLHSLDKKYQIAFYNIDLLEESHWMWRLVIPSFVNYFQNISFHCRNDQKKTLNNRLKNFKVLEVSFENSQTQKKANNMQMLLSSKEQTLYSLMLLSSTSHINSQCDKTFVSLELFEYCGRSFFEDKSSESSLISGFQNFINRSFDDFNFLAQEKSAQVFFTNSVEPKELYDERRRLSYYLRNHIEECLNYFDNPISLLILYYYVKDIVLDEKRTIAILEKLILTIKNKQQYTLVNTFWFQIAGEMFDATKLEEFDLTRDSIYRKLSIEALNNLKFLFERNGHFEQALLITLYLYEINPNRYAVDKCSLYERMGQFDNAYNSLPLNMEIEKSSFEKPTDTQVRYFQRKSWIIVSQREAVKKEEGLNLLKKLETILFSHHEDNEPLWLWHYYNIKANYAEWSEDYDKAIVNYQKCLAIPALGAFEYGATFVNMAIAYRFKFLTKSSQNFDIIDNAIKLGSIGVALKASVGDRDEMPVVLHNQALNILYKLVVLETTDKKLLQKVIELTTEGIKILDVTNSVKRLGIMLCENIIAKSLLGEDTVELTARLEKQWTLMQPYEKEQLCLIYDRFVQEGKCKPFNFLS